TSSPSCSPSISRSPDSCSSATPKMSVTTSAGDRAGRCTFSARWPSPLRSSFHWASNSISCSTHRTSLNGNPSSHSRSAYFYLQPGPKNSSSAGCCKIFSPSLPEAIPPPGSPPPSCSVSRTSPICTSPTGATCSSHPLPASSTAGPGGKPIPFSLLPWSTPL